MTTFIVVWLILGVLSSMVEKTAQLAENEDSNTMFLVSFVFGFVLLPFTILRGFLDTIAALDDLNDDGNAY